MDHLSSENLFSEMEVDDAAFVNEWMDTLDNNFVHFCPNDPFFPPACSTGNNGFYGTENNDGGVIRKPAVMNSVQCQPSAISASPLITAVSCNPSGGSENPVVKVKMKMKSEMDHRESSGKTMISFMPSSSSHQDYYCSGRGNDEHRESLIRTIEFGAGKGKTGSAVRSPLQAQDHVLAERKRRENLTQRFISLSALIPGLKKLDKVSVLGDAIKYIKELQERVRTLEEVDQEQTKRLENKELKKERVSGHDEDSSSLSDSDGNCETGTAIALPEIEVRASGQNLLIRVQCNNLHNHGGVIKEIFSEIERLHLSINTSHVMPFGNTTYITIAAQMDQHFSMEAKDVADIIGSTIVRLIRHGKLR